MRRCRECGQVVNDQNIGYCPRCGSGNLMNISPNQTRPNQNQGIPNQNRPNTSQNRVNQSQVRPNPNQTRPNQAAPMHNTEFSQKRPNLGFDRNNQYQNRANDNNEQFNDTYMEFDNMQIDNDINIDSTNQTNNTDLESENESIITFKEWILFYLKCLIPFYNLYIIVRTAIGGRKIKKSLTNMIRASLIYYMVLSVIFYGLSIALGTALTR